MAKDLFNLPQAVDIERYAKTRDDFILVEEAGLSRCGILLACSPEDAANKLEIGDLQDLRCGVDSSGGGLGAPALQTTIEHIPANMTAAVFLEPAVAQRSNCHLRSFTAE